MGSFMTATKRILGIAIAFAVVSAVALCQPNRVDAAFQMRLTQGANVVVLTDNDFDGPGGNPDDSDPLSGAMTFSGAVGNFIVTGTIGTSKPVFPDSPTFARMDMVNVSVSSTLGGTLIVELTDTDFQSTQGESGILGGRVGGTTQSGSAPLFDVYKSDSNVAFSQDSSGGGAELHLVPGFVLPGVFGDFDTVNHGPIGDFSMTLVATITHGGGGIVSTSFNFEAENVAGPGNIPFAPEPASMLVWGLGMGLVGAGGYWRRKRNAV
jgi:hypothetical protein